MDNKKMGEFICELRKVKSMTQKELAEKLNVTDKAVSKWERGNGYPEITIIPELAKALETTVNELLSGEKNVIELGEVKDGDLVNNTIEYVGKVKKLNALNIFSIISIVFLISAFVCLLCNFAISGLFDWSLYPTGALLLVWLTIIPLFFTGKHRGYISLFVMTLALIPYLFLVEYLCPVKGWVIPMAMPIIGISLIGLFIASRLFLSTKINKYYVVAINCILFGVIANISINNIVYNFVKEKQSYTPLVIIVISFAFISFLLFIIGYAKENRDVS